MMLCGKATAASSLACASGWRTSSSSSSSKFFTFGPAYIRQHSIRARHAPDANGGGNVCKDDMIRGPAHQYRLSQRTYRFITTRTHLGPRWSSQPLDTLTFARSASTSSTPQGSSNVQYVKIITPQKKVLGMPWGRGLLYVVYVALCIQIAASYLEYRSKAKSGKAFKPMTKIHDPKKQQDQATMADDPASGDNDDAEVEIDLDAEDAWFLPFGWPQKKALVPYKGSDEEWTEFRKFSTNEQKKRETRAQAVMFIQFIAEQNKSVNGILGPPVRCTRHWLDIDYPVYYSDGYEVKGLLINEDFMAWIAQGYDEQTVQRFLRIVSPVSLFTAFWGITRTVFGGGQIPITMSTGAETDSLPALPRFAPTPLLSQAIRMYLPQVQRPNTSDAVPKGHVVISGRIDVSGTREWASFHFFGCYDPKSDTWAGMPQFQLTAIRPLHLKPAG